MGKSEVGIYVEHYHVKKADIDPFPVLHVACFEGEHSHVPSSKTNKQMSLLVLAGNNWQKKVKA